jgi:hypothetical protein
MVATAAQIAANRANARRSTGPRTPEGKAASSHNALTHGAYASDDSILATTPNIYLEAFRARFQPADALEAHLVEHLAVLALRRDRLNAAMDALLELNERHALTEHLHERYGVNTPNAHIPGQPSWQAAMRRYDDNSYVDPRYPEPVSDPVLDPDPILCSLAYTFSSPRAAALFRHEAAVDRRFSATLKELTTLQAQRRAAAATASKTPSAPLHEPSLQRALDRYLRATATIPTGPRLDPRTPPGPTHPALSTPAHENAAPPDPPGFIRPSLPSRIHPEAVFMPVPDQTQSALPGQQFTTQYEQNEPAAIAAPVDHRAAPTSSLPSDHKIEANPSLYLPYDEPTTFLSVLPRHPDEPSSIPAHWPDALLLAPQ